MLSVVVPVRNGAAAIAGQLRSLAEQVDPPPWELVVADNGSTDGTHAAVRDFTPRFASLRVVDAGTRPGRHHACNVGVGAATGDAVVFLDADDEVAPTFLAAMAEALEVHDLVAPRLVHTGLQRPGAITWQTGGVEDTPFLPTATGAGLGIRRRVLDEVGGFDEAMDYCEDIDLCWRAQLAGFELAFCDRALVHYRQRASARTMFRQHRQYGTAWVRLRRKYAEHGMPGRPPRLVLAEWWAIAKAVPFLGDPETRLRWLRRTGRAVGRLQGSLRHRTLYL